MLENRRNVYYDSLYVLDMNINTNVALNQGFREIHSVEVHIIQPYFI